MLYCTLLVTQQQTSLSESSCKFPTFGFVQNALTKSPKKKQTKKNKKKHQPKPIDGVLEKIMGEEKFQILCYRI